MTIYLIGYISGEKIKECSEWRKKLRDRYEHWKLKETYADAKWERYPISWLDPLNGKAFEDIDKDGFIAKGITAEAIMHRDYQSVKKADLLIANLDTFGSTRPLTGSMFELAWAYDAHKPVIVITQDLNYINHPFIKETASIIVPTVDELIERKLINYFFKGWVNAEY
jgi:hypothetical protein